MIQLIPVLLTIINGPTLFPNDLHYHLVDNDTYFTVNLSFDVSFNNNIYTPDNNYIVDVNVPFNTLKEIYITNTILYLDNDLYFSCIFNYSFTTTNEIAQQYYTCYYDLGITGNHNFTNQVDTRIYLYDVNYYNNIYEPSYNSGYDSGYDVGKLEGNGINNVISWFGNIWDSLANFLSLQIAPNLSIGTIITIPIVIAVLFFGLKALIQ